MSTATREPLTKRQQQVYDVIRSFIASHGYSPTYREIGAALGITSTNGVLCNVKRLVAKGWVAFRKDASRTLHLLDDEAAPIVYVIERRSIGNGFGWWFHAVCDSFAGAQAVVDGRDDLRFRAVKMNEVAQ